MQATLWLPKRLVCHPFLNWVLANSAWELATYFKHIQKHWLRCGGEVPVRSNILFPHIHQFEEGNPTMYHSLPIYVCTLGYEG